MNLKKKIFLITGGTGSFGNAVLKRLLKTNISQIRIFSRDEKKQNDLRLKINDKRLKFIIGDVRDYTSIKDAMANVNYVFHAAALKQVPSCEFYPMEAIKTNVIGADNVTRAAIEYKIEKCILLSTDKAVYPINAMGLSKAMMEKIMLSKSNLSKKDVTIICATRYGNVMGTRGSVIPLFFNQLKNSLDLTVTNLKMSRFLMSVEESVELVLYALKNAKSGDIFVQKSPACTIEILIKALSKILNKNPKLKVIGMRHGEKEHETLISSEEMFKTIDLGKYFRIPQDTRDLNYEEYFEKGNKKNIKIISKDYSSCNTKQLSILETIKLINKSKVLVNFID